MSDTLCRECGEELWTAREAFGLCVNCQELEREELDGLDLEDQLDHVLAVADAEEESKRMTIHDEDPALAGTPIAPYDTIDKLRARVAELEAVLRDLRVYVRGTVDNANEMEREIVRMVEKVLPSPREDKP